MGNNPTSPRYPKRVNATMNRQKAVEMRIAGDSFYTIGKKLGISEQAAWDLVNKALIAQAKETAQSLETLRHQELARVDALQAAVWKSALSGDVKKIDRVLAIMRRRADLLGMDAPVKNTNISLSPDMLKDCTDEQIERLARGEDWLKVLMSPDRGEQIATKETTDDQTPMATDQDQ